MVPGVEASTGALGHGLSIGVGLALAARLRDRDYRTFVMLGDGEINEGSVWEAAMSASKHGLDNLVALIDYNKLQSYGPTDYVLPLEPLADKWRSFGFAVDELNGHDIGALRATLGKVPLMPGKPSVIICHTVKGKGLPAAESNADWHHKNKLTNDELDAIRVAVGEI
jgi:transketolase